MHYSKETFAYSRLIPRLPYQLSLYNTKWPSKLQELQMCFQFALLKCIRPAIAGSTSQPDVITPWGLRYNDMNHSSNLVI